MSDSSPSVSPHLLFIYLFVLHVWVYTKFIWLSISRTWRIQADRSEWAKLCAEAEKNDKQWLKDQLEQRHLKTLLQFIASAELRLGRHPSKEVCVAALVEHQFPLASRCGKQQLMLLNNDCMCRYIWIETAEARRHRALGIWVHPFSV